MIIKIKKILKKENTINILILFIASIFICLPLLNKNLDIGYDDRYSTYSKTNGNISITTRKADFSSYNVKLLQWIWLFMEFIL